MRVYYQFSIFMLATGLCFSNPVPTTFKPAPTRPSMEANIVIEDQEILETCDEERICVQGNLYNNGAKPAYQVKLQIEIGGMKQGKPRHTILQKADISDMEPGDRQEFYVTLKRKISLKNNKGEERNLEVGKYNFKIIPIWSTSKIISPPTKKRRR